MEFWEKLNIPITKGYIKSKINLVMLKQGNGIWNKEGENTHSYEWIRSMKALSEHFPTNHYREILTKRPLYGSRDHRQSGEWRYPGTALKFQM